MPNHTPTPWILGQDSTVFSENFLCLAIGAPNSETPIAVFMESNPNAGNDAEFVRRACNSHDALLAACKAALGDEQARRPGENRGLKADTVQQLKAAIALADEA